MSHTSMHNGRHWTGPSFSFISNIVTICVWSKFHPGWQCLTKYVSVFRRLLWSLKRYFFNLARRGFIYLNLRTVSCFLPVGFAFRFVYFVVSSSGDYDEGTPSWTKSKDSVMRKSCRFKYIVRILCPFRKLQLKYGLISRTIVFDLLKHD
jgi:hypothetical protein